MSARDVIASLMPGARLSEVQDQADNTISHLHAAGYRILGPDELDPVTVERCAKLAEAYMHVARENMRTSDQVGEAIRSLFPTQPEAKEARDGR